MTAQFSSRRLAQSILFLSFFLIFTFFAGIQTASADRLGDEVVFYDFEGTTGTTTNAGSGGSAYDGTYVGSASSSNVQAKFGSRSGSFGESGDFVRTYYGTGINPTTQSISVSMWVYKKEASAGCNTGDDDHFFGVSGPPVNTRFYIRCTNGVWGSRFGGAAAANSATAINHQTWQHIVLVFDAATDTPTLYVDNVLKATSATVSSYTIGDYFFVGNYNDRIATSTAEGGNVFIDDMAIYNRALNTSEIATLYNAGQAPTVPVIATTTPLSGKMYLAWTSTGTITDYLVEYKLSGDSTWTLFNDGVSTSAFTTVTGLTDGQTYNFRVAAKNNSTTTASSSAATAVPTNRIVFVSPTPGQSSTTASPISVSASSSSMTASSTHTLRLETSLGSLVSQISTTTRYGNYNLTNLTNIASSTDLSLAVNSSGVVYATSSKTLFVVHNAAIGSNSTIDEISSSTGSLIRTITCTGCGDTEGITLLSSASDGGGGYTHTFMISTENNPTGGGEIFRVTIASTTTTVSTSSGDYIPGVPTFAANGGLEGIAYNPQKDVYYLAQEISSPTLYEYKLGGTAVPICTNLTWASSVSDFSDLAFNNNILYVLSENTNPSKLVPIDVTSTSSCAYVDSNGNGIASSSDSGDWLNNIPVGSTDQAEGVAWDDTGDYLYVLGEADFFAKYRTNAYTVRTVFSGLSNGDYVLKSSFTDGLGLVENAADRAFTISNPDTTAPVITFTSTSTSSTTATIIWTTNEAATSTVQYGLTTSYGSVATSSGTSSHSVIITGLTASTTYQFKIVATDPSSNTSSTTNMTFTTGDGVPPVISSISSSTATSTATISWSTDESASSTVQYGLTTSYGSQATSSGTSTHSVSLSGLTQATLYHYRVTAIDAFGNISTSTDRTFTTTDGTAPTVSITSPSAGTVSGTVSLAATTTDNVGVVGVKFYLDTTLIGSEDTTSPFTGSLVSTGFSDGAYTLTAVARDAAGNAATSSGIALTIDNTAANITSIASSTATSSASITWSTNEAASSTVQYGLTTSYGSVATSSGTSTHSVSLTGLTPNTLYHYKVFATDAVGNVSSSTDKTFTTTVYVDTTAPVTQNVSVTVDQTTASATWTTDEAATSTFRYSLDTSYASSSLSAGTTNHSASISSLSPSTLYHYVIVSRDASGNTSTTSDATFTTSATPAAATPNNIGIGVLTSSSGGSAGFGAFGAFPQANNQGNNPNNAPAPQNAPQAQLPAIKSPGALQQGIINNDIRIIQKILNKDNDTKVAKKGIGSPGNETNYFGPATRQAIQKFQLKHGIVKDTKDPGFGIIGPKTKAKLNEIGAKGI